MIAENFVLSKIVRNFGLSTSNQSFYEADNGTKISGEQVGASPAVLSMPRIGLACGDSPRFVSPNPNQMHAKLIPVNLRPHYLYVLRDPRTREIKYVGVTNNPEKRGRDHRTLFKYDSNKNPLLFTWRTQLKMLGTRPVFEIIKKFDNYESAHRMEISLIHSLGNSIFNIAHNDVTV